MGECAEQAEPRDARADAARGAGGAAVGPNQGARAAQRLQQQARAAAAAAVVVASHHVLVVSEAAIDVATPFEHGVLPPAAAAAISLELAQADR